MPMDRKQTYSDRQSLAAKAKKAAKSQPKQAISDKPSQPKAKKR